jgi:hypothetical protein
MWLKVLALVSLSYGAMVAAAYQRRSIHWQRSLRHIIAGFLCACYCGTNWTLPQSSEACARP